MCNLFYHTYVDEKSNVGWERYNTTAKKPCYCSSDRLGQLAKQTRHICTQLSWLRRASLSAAPTADASGSNTAVASQNLGAHLQQRNTEGTGGGDGDRQP